MIEVEIDEGVELPPAPVSKGRVLTYPFPELKVDDSFFVKSPNGRELYAHVSALGNSARAWAKTQGNGWTFAVRREGDKGARIWRTA